MNGALKFKLLRITDLSWNIVAVIVCAILGVLCVMIGNVFNLMIAAAVCSGTITSILTNDEKFHMHYYMDAMPYSRREMLNAEYLAEIILTVLVTALMLIFALILMLLLHWAPDTSMTGYNSISNVILLILFYVPGFALILTGLVLAGFYYGLNRIITIVLMLPILAGGFFLSIRYNMGFGMILLVFAIGVAAFALSWYKSAGRNEKRDI